MKNFSGRVLFLDRDDINTDEIIPAKYLTESTKGALKPFILEDLKLDGFDPTTDCTDRAVVVTRNNFGCGSSREHAPWVFEMNDINMVVATGFARIFRQNMFNCGMIALTLDPETIDHLFEQYKGTEATITTDLEAMHFTIDNNLHSEKIPFKVSEFDLALVRAGGWVNYADSNY
ncbi:LeuD1 [Desulforapulum autotrophicum HRM2]|uniref:LeuD1 n=1 Tax=Desulforapulum autotrophicum (strain ATCC 43914 / DSM 3382 / VKM B-1955 / HRM2) TaxID=177437 RepID=C0QBP4_DESAH|nr:3-isopropylmalate dehydratase small subunit [Desulforapulum autotrophicum]ACN14906.1 LeuD1 [Desulforapulum autotrophicum HRM2]